MRIISGKHRGRRIQMHEGKEIRPTSGRTREAIFNILTHADFAENKLAGGRVVDIFCGSGALGLEALSRGADHITFVDRNPQSLSLARENTERFGEIENARFIRNDSTQLPPAPIPCSLAFADPPYNKGKAIPALKSLHENGWLEDGAIVVLEISEHDVVDTPAPYTLEDERKYSKSRVLFLRYNANS